MLPCDVYRKAYKMCCTITVISSQPLHPSTRIFTKSPFYLKFLLPPLAIMHIAQAIISASFVLGALATPQGSSQCNEGGASFTCSDATTACNQVHSYDYSFGTGKTAMQIATYASATVWLTRAKSSASRGDMNALCKQIVSDCCQSNGYMTKSQIPFPTGEQGSVQIVNN